MEVRVLPDACSSFLLSYRSLFKSACSLSLLGDQQPENFCSTQHCLKCPHSSFLLLTVLWDTNVSPQMLLGLGPGPESMPHKDH